MIEWNKEAEVLLALEDRKWYFMIEWNKEAEVLLALEDRKWMYRHPKHPMNTPDPVKCIITSQGPHEGELIVVVPSTVRYFGVSCKKHLQCYLDAGWHLYD